MFSGANAFKGTLCGGAWARLGTSQARLGCCPAGSYMVAPELSFSIAKSCSKCPVGQFGSNELNDDTSCPGTCPAGQSSSEGATSCQDCAVGKYSTAAGSACENCVAGKSSLPGKTSEADCSACEEGQSSTAGSECKGCAAGEEVTSSGCKTCSKGKYRSSNAAATALCKECVVGRYIVDDGTDATQHESCKTCPLGYEIVVDDVTKPCDKCTFSKVRFLIEILFLLLLIPQLTKDPICSLFDLFLFFHFSLYTVSR